MFLDMIKIQIYLHAWTEEVFCLAGTFLNNRGIFFRLEKNATTDKVLILPLTGHAEDAFLPRPIK